MSKIRVIFTNNSYYFEIDIPSKEEISQDNLARIVRKHGGIYKWVDFHNKRRYYPPLTKRFFKCNHTAAGISKKDFDKQMKQIMSLIKLFKYSLPKDKNL